jgi:hypothetical protein
MQKKRKPRTIRGTKADVTTRLRIRRRRAQLPDEHRPGDRRAPGSDPGADGDRRLQLRAPQARASWSVAGHAANRKRIRWVFERSSESFADAFGRFDRDRPWIAARVRRAVPGDLRERAALTKGGTIRSSVLEGADNGV